MNHSHFKLCIYNKITLYLLCVLNAVVNILPPYTVVTVLTIDSIQNQLYKYHVYIYIYYFLKCRAISYLS